MVIYHRALFINDMELNKCEFKVYKVKNDKLVIVKEPLFIYVQRYNDYFGKDVKIKDILSKSRNQKFTFLRQAIAVIYIYKYKGYTIAGRKLNRTHGTMFYAQKLGRYDIEIKKIIKAIDKEKITPKLYRNDFRQKKNKRKKD